MIVLKHGDEKMGKCVICRKKEVPYQYGTTDEHQSVVCDDCSVLLDEVRREIMED